jgi:hypothetical protein
MVVFSNHRLGPSAELMVSDEVARGMLAAVIAVEDPPATGRWERELVRWLGGHAGSLPDALDVSDIAWTPDHFELQRNFLIERILGAFQVRRDLAAALSHWRRMIEAHPREAVQVGRLWQFRQDAIPA